MSSLIPFDFDGATIRVTVPASRAAQNVFFRVLRRAHDMREMMRWAAENVELLAMLREVAELDDEICPADVINLKREIENDAECDIDYHLYSLLMEICTQRKSRLRSEHSAYAAVARHLSGSIHEGASRADVISGDGTPVEVKIGPFGNRALEQLSGYMKKLGKSRGIACAPSLSCVLPENVSFLQIAYVDRIGWSVVSGGDQ